MTHELLIYDTWGDVGTLSLMRAAELFTATLTGI